LALNGLLTNAITALSSGGPQTLFLYSFATGFGFGSGVLASAALFHLIPGP